MANTRFEQVKIVVSGETSSWDQWPARRSSLNRTYFSAIESGRIVGSLLQCKRHGGS